MQSKLSLSLSFSPRYSKCVRKFERLERESLCEKEFSLKDEFRAMSRNIGISNISIYIYIFIFWELQIEPCGKLINQSTLGKQILRETNTKSQCEFLMAPNRKNGDFLSFVTRESIKKSSSIQCRPAKIPDSATSSFF